jgi:hypothetical protein
MNLTNVFIYVNKAVRYFAGLPGPALKLCAQFQAICDMTDAGRMVGHEVVMLGYHNGAFSGDVC